MFWLHEHNRVWRVPILVLILMALIGPWAFDRVNVPSHYPCSAPSVRLEGDFCGLPLSGVLILSFMVIGLVWTTAELVAWGLGALVFLLLVLLYGFSFSGCTGSSGGYGSTADYLPPP